MKWYSFLNIVQLKQVYCWTEIRSQLFGINFVSPPYEVANVVFISHTIRIARNSNNYLSCFRTMKIVLLLREIIFDNFQKLKNCHFDTVSLLMLLILSNLRQIDNHSFIRQLQKHFDEIFFGEISSFFHNLSMVHNMSNSLSPKFFFVKSTLSK